MSKKGEKGEGKLEFGMSVREEGNDLTTRKR